ncbi:MAG: hypothetical protein E7Z87_06455 [Cyanobacteria bacterium SIG26]|nr:hypothetical protein [Cyanobacteria bacterium SIG26]
MANLKEQIFTALKSEQKLTELTKDIERAKENLLKNHSNPVFNISDKNKILKAYMELDDINRDIGRFDRLRQYKYTTEALQERKSIEDILKGGMYNYNYIWKSENSSNTCEVCRALNGREFDFYDEVPQRPHPNCRCKVKIVEGQGRKKYNISHNENNIQLSDLSSQEQVIYKLGKFASRVMKVSGSNLQNSLNDFEYAKKNEHAHIIDSRVKISNPGLVKLMNEVNIPLDSRGVIYDSESDQSKLLWRSPEIQGFVKSNLKNLKSGKMQDVYDIEFIKKNFPYDNFLALQHCKLYNPKITPEGNFHGLIVDYYDFKYRTGNDIITDINNWGYSMQEKGKLEKHFVIYIIYEKL